MPAGVATSGGRAKEVHCSSAEGTLGEGLCPYVGGFYQEDAVLPLMHSFLWKKLLPKVPRVHVRGANGELSIVQYRCCAP